MRILEEENVPELDPKKKETIKSVSLTVLTADSHFVAILASPHDVRLWITIRFACQRDVRSLPDHQVVAGQRFGY